ncbi:CST complex subunit CTC1 [Apostasia shenzhenica]|uniref:CST complex subunit CTC1 n=1 Tax=Apostasia shenzhenica TaxID=1088818 RepID=A0A2I0B5I3_9ASPA|nr:CST complex subunit CTC1 [Apostasia shenzhenica]
MAEVLIISISDLVSLSRPLTGAASLVCTSSASPPPLKKHRANPSPTSLTELLLPDENSNPVICFTPIKRPVLLVGTVDLPTDPFNQFLSFSDDSFAICCDILDFDLAIVGCKIHVFAWNFVPFKHRRGGLLEVIRWGFAPSLTVSKDNFCLSLRKAAGISSGKGIVGVLTSVSPVFTVPCRNQGCDETVGFLAEIFTCKCSLCCKSLYLDGFNLSIWQKNSHSFTDSEFVYFIKPTSRWRLALARLIGKLVVVSGLKKKMIFVGDKTSYLLLITTQETAISSCCLPLEIDHSRKVVKTRMIQEGKVYSGVVTGFYMQGMIFVRNFHLVRLEFSWIRTNLLVSCCRTTIDLKTFSHSDSTCFMGSKNQILLQKFIKSLMPTATFWLLLLISCFRRKFSKTFSENEILGSRDVIALLHSVISLSENLNGIFMEFCKYGKSIFKLEQSKLRLKLVVPISNFIGKCEMIWMTLINKMQSLDEKLESSHNTHSLPCHATSSFPISRRIISSEVLGCILMGSIKCTSSGRMQLVDATGSIDVVIPDILSSFHCQGIHEVKKFKVVVEGSPIQQKDLQIPSTDPFSFKNIFGLQFSKKMSKHLTLYVHFYLQDSTCLNAPTSLPLCKDIDCYSSARGIAHLFLVTHKFPTAKYCVATNALHCSSLFAEAVLLPYDIFLEGEDEFNPHLDVVAQKLYKWSGYKNILNNTEIRCCKEMKFTDLPNRDSPTGTIYGPKEAEVKPCFPRLLAFARRNSQRPHAFGNISYKGGIMLENKSHSVGKVLLEFFPDSFIKYQLYSIESTLSFAKLGTFKFQSLRLGEYYIMKCSKECSLCSQKDCKQQPCAKVLLTSQTSLWKISLSFGDIAHQKGQQGYSTPVDHLNVDYHQTYNAHDCQNCLEFQKSNKQLIGTSDIHLLVSHDKMGSINNMEASEELLFSCITKLPEILTVSSVSQIMKSDISRPFSSADSHGSRLLTKNLISFRGDVEAMHLYKRKAGIGSSEQSFQLIHCSELIDSGICLHVHDEQCMIRIRGKHCAFPVGMGSGVNATFHRILLKRSSGGIPKLVLTSVSFVVINSVKELSIPCSRREINLLPGLVRNRDKSVNSVFPNDGSSLCCCWADGERAAMLLRLHEVLCQTFFQNGASSAYDRNRYHDTIGGGLEKMLKKHHKIIVKNCRTVPEVSAADFAISVCSDDLLSNAEESLLRYIIINACQGSILNIVGHMMDSTALDFLDTNYEGLQDALSPLHNIQGDNASGCFIYGCDGAFYDLSFGIRNALDFVDFNVEAETAKLWL